MFVGSMLFGLFFGAGNLIFPVHMGQQAGSNILLVTLGFVLTGVGLPFLGIMALGVSKSAGLFDLASRISPSYALVLTVLLALTVGPAFALPRLGSVSYEIGLAPFISPQHGTLALFIFSVIFYALSLVFSLKPGKILLWIGKVLNPLFLVFLAVLIGVAFYHVSNFSSFGPVQSDYASAPFVRGFTQGYNTMDALGALVVGIVVIDALRSLGLKTPSEITCGLLKSGIVAVLLMCIIYFCLSYMGAYSLAYVPLSANGGIALAQIAKGLLGTGGGILLAIIVTIACLKTSIGLTSSCANIFVHLFPHSVGYKTYTLIFSLISLAMSNISLTQIIILAVPLLMFLYPLCMTLILLSFLAPCFQNARSVYVVTTLFTVVAAFGDALNNLPPALHDSAGVQGILALYHQLPFFAIGMGWTTPALVGFGIGLVVAFFSRRTQRA